MVKSKYQLCGFNNISRVTSFRNSKLTRILGESLSGNAKVAVVCAVSPDPSKVRETKRTLEFGSNAQKICIKPTVNSECDNALILKYQTELESLQSELQALREKVKNQGSEGSDEKEETEEEMKQLESVMKDLTDSMVTNKTLISRLQDVESEKRDREEKIKQMEEERNKLQEMLAFEEERKRIQEMESRNKDMTLISLQQETMEISNKLQEIANAKKEIETQSQMKESQINSLINYNSILEEKMKNEELSRRKAEAIAHDQIQQIELFKKRNQEMEVEYIREKQAKEEASRIIQEKLEEVQTMRHKLEDKELEKENYEAQLKLMNDSMTTMYNMWKDDFDREIAIRDKEKNQLNEQVARLTLLVDEKDMKLRRMKENVKSEENLQQFITNLETEARLYKQIAQQSESERKKSLEVLKENVDLKKKIKDYESELEAFRIQFKASKSNNNSRTSTPTIAQQANTRPATTYSNPYENVYSNNPYNFNNPYDVPSANDNMNGTNRFNSGIAGMTESWNNRPVYSSPTVPYSNYGISSNPTPLSQVNPTTSNPRRSTINEFNNGGSPESYDQTYRVTTPNSPPQQQQQYNVRNRPRNFTGTSSGGPTNTLPTQSTNVPPTSTVTPSRSYRVTGEKAFVAQDQRATEQLIRTMERPTDSYDGFGNLAARNNNPTASSSSSSKEKISTGGRLKRSLSLSKIMGMLRGDDKKNLIHNK